MAVIRGQHAAHTRFVMGNSPAAGSESPGRARTVYASPDVLALSAEQCWSRLRTQRLGRVVINVHDRPHLFPVNYAVGESAIVFRTSPGAKLEHGPGSISCFEVDEYDPHTLEGWSVMAFGRLEDITEATDEASRELRRLAVKPDAPGSKLHWMALKVEELSGRHFNAGWTVPGVFLG
ncbi:MAG TPA: pyridoxamine 5'-phosphate oxidase family protein [Candidatus Dormibacteraeota bacterium]|nr:pyridoxamine 5'-phosphate oxidase family protein [Candidatus Dormibacteraeota bacterium]